MPLTTPHIPLAANAQRKGKFAMLSKARNMERWVSQLYDFGSGLVLPDSLVIIEFAE